MSEPNFGALAPSGMQTVLELRKGLTAVQGAFTEFFNSGLIALANDDRSIYEKPVSSTWKDLTKAMQVFQATSIVPVNPMRELITYSSTFAVLVPQSAGVKPSDIANALETLVAQWTPVDNQAYNDGCTATRDYLDKVSTPIAPVRASFVLITQFMEDCLNGSLSSSDTPWKSLSLFETFQKALEPLTTVTYDRDGIFRLNETLGLTLEMHQYDKTFLSLVKDNRTTAELALSAITVFNGSTRVLLTQLATCRLQITGLSGSYAGMLAAMNKVQEGIRAFGRSIEQAAINLTPVVVTRQSVLKGWAVIGKDADLYIANIGNPSSNLNTAALASSLESTWRRGSTKPRAVRLEKTAQFAVNLESSEIGADKRTPEQVRDAFGPPEYSVSALNDLAAQTSVIQNAFNSLLTVPYVDLLVIKMENGSEVKLRDMILGMQTKYEALQASTLPVAIALYSNAQTQVTLLPKVNQKDGNLTLSDYLVASMQMVLAFQKSAAAIVRDTTELRDEFQGYLDILNKNLADMEKQIATTERDIEKAEQAYKVKVLTSVFEFVIGTIFGIVAVVAAATGVATPIGVALGIAATVALSKGIADAVDAGTEASLIRGLKDFLDTCKETKKQLDDAIPKLSLIVDMMSNISNIWGDILLNLQNIKEHEDLWNNPIYFTKGMIDDTVQSWQDVSTACTAYGNIVGGLTPTTPSTFASDPLFANKVFANMMFDLNSLTEAPPPVYSAFAHHPVAARLVLERNAYGNILDFLSAPDVAVGGLRKDELLNAASAWKSAGQALWSIGQTAIADDCNFLGLQLEDKVASYMSLAVKKLLEFAGPEPILPELPVDASRWREFCDLKLASLSPGLQQAVLCDTVLRDLQNQAQLVSNACLAKRSQLQFLRDEKDRERREAQDTYNSYRWLIYIPSPVAILIEVLVETIRNDTDQINQLDGQLRQIDDALSKFQSTMDIIGRLFRYTKVLSTFWASLTTKVNTATTLWTVLDQYPALEINLARRSWAAARDAFQDWS